MLALAREKRSGEPKELATGSATEGGSELMMGKGLVQRSAHMLASLSVQLTEQASELQSEGVLARCSGLRTAVVLEHASGEAMVPPMVQVSESPSVLPMARE